MAPSAARIASSAPVPVSSWTLRSAVSEANPAATSAPSSSGSSSLTSPSDGTADPRVQRDLARSSPRTWPTPSAPADLTMPAVEILPRRTPRSDARATAGTLRLSSVRGRCGSEFAEHLDRDARRHVERGILRPLHRHREPREAQLPTGEHSADGTRVQHGAPHVDARVDPRDHEIGPAADAAEHADDDAERW